METSVLDPDIKPIHKYYFLWDDFAFPWKQNFRLFKFI